MSKLRVSSFSVSLDGYGAGPSQDLEAGLVDELHLAIAPVLLGAGENLWAGLDLPKLGYRCVESAPGKTAMHVVLRKG